MPGMGSLLTDYYELVSSCPQAAINEAKDSTIQRLALRALISQSGAKIFVCHNATALAWGYTDKFIRALHGIGKYPLDYVSIQNNNSIYDLNISTINTGVVNISKVGQYIQWNGLRELSIWEKGTDANNIRGTEGLFFRPNLKKGDNLTVFIDDVMRSFHLLYEGKVKHLGLSALRFGIDNCTFKSAFSEPSNAKWFSWCPDGMFYLGPTQVKEIPVYGSKPHFLDGDPLLLESVTGLHPIREQHDTIFDLEPITGANILLRRQFQINVQVNKTKKQSSGNMHETQDIKGYNNSGVLYLPVLYVNEVNQSLMKHSLLEYLKKKKKRFCLYLSLF